MKLLEYEAKTILKKYSITIPSSELITDKSESLQTPLVLKSQVPVGKRGKAGGIKVVKDESSLPSTISKLFSLSINGFTPRALLAEELLSIRSEYYLSLIVDRDTASVQLIANKSGGIEVEDNTTDSFLKISISNENIQSLGGPLSEYFNIPTHSEVLQNLIQQLFLCFIESDATLVEINPLILTTEGNLVAGDCKMTLDDAAIFRHPEWNFNEESEDTNFVTLNKAGTVATIANGAGLAMATVDAVADIGLIPANFLDIGGGANEASTLAAFEKIVQYPNIQAIVINIFAGITRCDEVAKAIISAKEKIETLPPLYIRLAGTNFKEAADLLEASGISLQPTLDACLEAVRRKVGI